MEGRPGTPWPKVLQLNEAHAEAAIRDDRKEMSVLVPMLRHLINSEHSKAAIKDDRKIIFV